MARFGEPDRPGRPYRQAMSDYHTQVDVDGDGTWDAYVTLEHGGGVDIFADMDGDQRADFIGHDYDRDGWLDEAVADRDRDGRVDLAGVDRNEDGALERVVLDDDFDGRAEIILEDRDLDRRYDVVGRDVDADGLVDSVVAAGHGNPYAGF